MKSIESSGKTVREAIEDGLKKLNKSLGEVEVKILSQGGLLRKARVMITAQGAEEESEELNIDYLGRKRERSEEELLEREKRYAAYSENIKIPDDAEMQKPVKTAAKPKTENNGRSGQRDNRGERNERGGERRNDNSERRNDNRPRESDNKPRENKFDNRKNGQNERGGERNERNERNERGGERRNDSERRNDNRPRENRARTHENTAPERRFREESFSPLNQEASSKAESFLSGMLNAMGVTHTLEAQTADNQLNLRIVCESGAVIGYRGETLSALEYLTCLSVSHGNERYKISVDCNGYKEKREQSLIALAERMAAKALKTGRKVVLEPMSSSSRKVIHSVLADNDKLITKSEGNEPNRRIVLLPKRQKPSRPQNQNNENSQSEAGE